MSSSPTVRNTDNIVTVIERDWKWVTSHAILVVLTGLVLLGLVYGIFSMISKRDEAAAQRAQAVLAMQQQVTQSLQAQLQADEAHWAALAQQLAEQNSQLASQISVRNQQVQKQVTNDATLSATEAAKRLAAQTQAGAGEVVAKDNDIVLSLPVTRNVVANLDLLRGTQADLQDTQKQLANETQIALNAQTDVIEQKKIAANLNTQLADAGKACDAKITAINAKHRKNLIKAFVAGFVAGLIGAHYMGI